MHELKIAHVPDATTPTTGYPVVQGGGQRVPAQKVEINSLVTSRAPWVGELR